MTYYIKGGSRYNEASPTVWVALTLNGFVDAKYLDADWKQIDYEGIIDSQDPFWLMGSISGGAKELELGLYNDYRIKFETTGITYWDGNSWEDLLALGGASNLNELGDVVIDGTPADNELLAWDNGTSKWINQTAGEAELATAGHGHGQLHDESHTLASHSTKAHNELTGYNDETDVKHITDAQLGDLHTIYSLEQHNNTHHSTNYHTEADGTGVITVHSDITSVGSGDIITTGERNALHSIYTLEQHNNDYHNPDYCVDDDSRLSDARTPTAHVLATTGPHTDTLPWTDLNKTGSSLADLATRVHSNLSDAPTSAHHVKTVSSEILLASMGEKNHASLANKNAETDVKHLTDAELGDLHSDVIVSVANVESVITAEIVEGQSIDNAIDTLISPLKEQSSTFPVSPSVGDFHYDEDDDSLYRRNGEAEAWVEVGTMGAIASSTDNLGNHTATEDLNMATNNIINVVDPVNDQDAATKNYVLDKAKSGIASDDLVFSNDAEQYTLNDLWVKAKEIIIYKSSKLRVYWEMKVGQAPYTAKSKIYINGVAVGAEKSSDSTTYLPYTEDVEVNYGDLLQIYGWVSLILERCYIQNMRLKFIEFVSNDP